MSEGDRKLAVLGGVPRFAAPLHVGQPNIGDAANLLGRVRDAVQRHWLTNDGPLVQEFESRIADQVGVKHCIAMCNATVALEIAVRAIKLTGEVIVPSYTFVATAHALQWQEITPVFCDIDPATHTINPARVEELLTPRTRGIIGVHLWGRVCHVEALQEIADRRGLALIFDAAHAFGCSRRGRMVGGFGRAEVFSFHATKFIQCGEGGAVVTNDDDLAAQMRLMRNFGFAGYDNVIYIGTNGKMSELSAAMGLTSLDSMDEFVTTNRRNYELYREELADLPGVTMLTYSTDDQNNFQYIVLDVDGGVCPLTRDQLWQVLHSENVLARRYFYPGVHRMEPYRSYYPNAYLLLPVTERIVRSVLVLPTGTSIKPQDIRNIAGILRTAIEAASDLRGRLPAEMSPRAGRRVVG